MEHVAVISHDAGGAEILSSWLNHTHYRSSAVVAGPAVAIFKRKCPQVEVLTLEDALAECTWVLCGTGWQSNFERKAISLGRSLSKKTVAFLDHWVNYQERFEEAGRLLLPDELWVGDKDAERIARGLFHTTPVVLQANPYVEDLLVEINRIRISTIQSLGARVLYVCEPISEHALRHFGNERHWGYTEYDALRFFLTNLTALGDSINSITIRPHPSEHQEKYHWARDLVSFPIGFGGQKTLLEETLESDIVVGCESMAMIVGLLAEKRVISTIPPGGQPCRLPQRDIEHMHLLVGASKHYV